MHMISSYGLKEYFYAFLALPFENCRGSQKKLQKYAKKPKMTFATQNLILLPWDQYGMFTLSIPTFDFNMMKIEGH